MIRWTSVFLGGLTFVGTYLVEAAAWRRWFDTGGVHAPWFLNSGRAVAFTAACLVVGGAVVGAAGRGAAVPTRRDALLRGASFAGGACAAMAAVLFRGGAGTLFPIVLGIGAAVAAGSSVTGALIGRGLRLVWAHRRQSRPRP